MLDHIVTATNPKVQVHSILKMEATSTKDKSTSQPTARRTRSRARYTIILIVAIHKKCLESLCGDISGQYAEKRYNKLESIMIEKS